MTKKIVFFISLIIFFSSIFQIGWASNENFGFSPKKNPLTFDERMLCQRAIEKTYWQYRIWPKENPQPKPSFESMIPEESIRAKVEDGLKKTNALQYYWHKSIAGEQLQAEIIRMAQHTKKPEILNAIWNKMGNDPHLVAECLVRPILADKMIRESYSSDQTMVKERGSFNEWWEVIKLRTSPLIDESAYNYFLPKIDFVTCGVDAWIATSTISAPEGRSWHTAVWTGTEMIIWGGCAQGICFNIGGRYNPILDSWIPTSAINAPTPRRNHTAVWTGIEMIIWGGWGITDPGGRYNPVSDSWVPTSTTNAPTPRRDHTAVWTGTEMIIWGGNNNSSSYFNTGSRYNPISDLWIPTTTINAPTPRSDHTAVWTGTEMIVWGGWNSYSMLNFNTGGRYDPTTDSWLETSTDTTLEGRFGHSAIWTGTEMIIWGGEHCFVDACSQYRNGGRYDPSSNSWIATITTNAPNIRSFHTTVWTGTEMIIWGGWYGNISRTYLNSGGRYNPGTNTWIATKMNNAPSARVYHTAVWTGTEMIIWRGYYYDGTSHYLDTGGRYNPGNLEWMTTTPIGAPSARDSHSAVWTGTEMIIWGGKDTSSCFNTGGRYNAVTDSWSSTSTINAPEGRSMHTAIWTGTEMVVWGGRDASSYYNSGGRYNPAADLWIVTNTTNAPSERINHTAVWTGTEMIIWGGWNGTSYFRTGGKYNPWSDSWSAMTTNYSLSARGLHTAVWTGTDMIIWGGWNGTSYFNNGYKYNPGTNSWISITPFNSPSARNNHTAVWTGTEMIIWGGYGSIGDIDTGARYNPFWESWAAMATTDAPSARHWHTAVWTDTEMIIWGGYINGAALNTGAKYNPDTNSWIETSTNNVPCGRSSHSAIWSGTAMIIWGGDDINGALDSGGIYCTSPCSAPVFAGINSAVDVNSCQTTGIRTTWQDSIYWGNGATGGSFEIRRYTNANCTASYAPIAGGLSPSTTSYTDTTAVSGITYYYQVVARNNCSPPASTTGTAACSSAVADNGFAPADLVNNAAMDLEPCADTGVLISWNADPGNWGDAGTGTRSYDILRNGSSIASFSYGVTNFIDLTGTNGTAYSYRVRYNNGCWFSTTTSPGASAMDNEDVTPCPNVGNTLLVTKTSTDAVLSWTAVACADLANYRVYGSVTYNAEFPSGWTILGNPACTNFPDPLVSIYIAYKILSIDVCGNVGVGS